MKTTLYLIQHEACAPVNADLHHRRVELTRDFLAVRALEASFCGPVAEVVETATLLAAPHGHKPQVLEGLAGPRSDETLARFQTRVTRALEDVLNLHPGLDLLVLAQPAAAIAYLSGLLGVVGGGGHGLDLDDYGISLLVRADGPTRLHTLNASFHLQGAAFSARGRPRER